MTARHHRIDHVAVVGAGMVGLATAWFLQERGVKVTVLDRSAVAAGASWGNAGWVSPALVGPLPEPAVLRYGVRALLSHSSPVYVPPRLDLDLARFLLRFARNCTSNRWHAALRTLVPLTGRALEAFDDLATGGVRPPTNAAPPLIAAYRGKSESRALRTELTRVRDAGMDVEYDTLTGGQTRDAAPILSDAITAGIRLRAQRFLDPPALINGLAGHVKQRGAIVHTGSQVCGISDTGGAVEVRTTRGEHASYDAVVLANGAWAEPLARTFGVRPHLQAGRGYSFRVTTPHRPTAPVYLPAQRVVCTPLSSGLRISGMMEFRPADAPLDPRRITTIVDAVRPLLRGLDLDARRDEWVGPRPCTPNGLPLIGRTASPRVFLATGHGMWGITLGPVTGKLLAQCIVTGESPPEILPFSPTAAHRA